MIIEKVHTIKMVERVKDSEPRSDSTGMHQIVKKMRIKNLIITHTNSDPVNEHVAAGHVEDRKSNEPSRRDKIIKEKSTVFSGLSKTLNVLA